MWAAMFRQNTKPPNSGKKEAATTQKTLFPDRDKRLIFLQTVTTGSEAHPTPRYNGHRGSFTGGKSAGA